jgi:hypothetical protein
VNDDGFVDIILPNAHGYIERAPTWIYTQQEGKGETWPRQELPNDSGWMSRVVDVDGDGYPDLVVVNGENGVTSELNSYVYWGGPSGLTGERTDLPTAGAYDVAALDLNDNGRLSLLFPSAWVDHHNRGKSRLVQVYEQVAPRRFEDVSERYGLAGVAAVSIACDDLTGDGLKDLVVCNYRAGFEYDTESFVYWGTEDGFDTRTPLRLPTHYALQVALADLNGDGRKEILFSGGDRIYIYWNDEGRFAPEDRTILEAEGNRTMFCVGALRIAVADVDGDGANELLVATAEGVQIRAAPNWGAVKQLLPLQYCGWVEAVDLDGDGRPDIIASKYQDGRMYDTESAIFWNGPDGFSPDRSTRLPTCGAVGCTAGDLDGDGRPEIIFNNTMRSWSQFNPDFPLYVYLGSEGGSYDSGRRLELPTGGGTNTYVVADLDQDGYNDLVFVSPEGLRIFWSGLEGLRPDHYTVLPGRGAPFGHVIVADLNRDGWLDLLAVPWTYNDEPETMANSTIIYWGGPEGFSAERSTVIPTYCQGNGHLADINNDGWLDFLYGDSRGYLGVFLGGPSGFGPGGAGWEPDLKIPLEGTNVATVSSINSADLDGDGWLDLIVDVMGHYTRKPSGFFLLYGGPGGFAQERIEFHPMPASSVRSCLADINRDGYLDLLVPAYSTQFSRELPAHIFFGSKDGFDFENPLVIPCDSSCAFAANDLTGNGYPDILAVCHRNDLGHQVDSLLFRNGHKGVDFDQVTRLPGLGPHLAASRDFGNALTREPVEYYVSPPYYRAGLRPVRINWEGETPGKTSLKFQLRWAETEAGLAAAPWQGPDGEGSFYERSGQEIGPLPEGAQWIQYTAHFLYTDGCRSPKMREVRIDLAQGLSRLNG